MRKVWSRRWLGVALCSGLFAGCAYQDDMVSTVEPSRAVTALVAPSPAAKVVDQRAAAISGIQPAAAQQRRVAAGSR